MLSHLFHFITFRTLQCTLYTIHYTLYTVHYTLYTVQCTLYTVQCTLYTVHSTLYTSHCTLYTVQGSSKPLIKFQDWITHIKTRKIFNNNIFPKNVALGVQPPRSTDLGPVGTVYSVQTGSEETINQLNFKVQLPTDPSVFYLQPASCLNGYS